MKIEKSARPRLGLLLIALGVVFNILETWYFGWNMHPESVQEALADGVCTVLLFVGFFELISLHIVTGSDAKKTEEDGTN